MKNLFEQKVVFFGGKGGVGKTTCSSAYSLLASRRNKRTLLISTDPAHSLSDLFGKTIGKQETKIFQNLFGLEIDPDHEARAYIQKVKANVHEWLNPDSRETFNKQMEFALVSPGVQEAALFDKITELITRSQNPYDLLVFDTAPTGQTLRLLTLPELMGSWTQTLLKSRRKVTSFFSMFKNISKESSGEDSVLSVLEKRRAKFETARSILTDAAKTAFYLVLTAEKLPILETQKAIPVLLQHRIPIRGMIVNRLLPEDAEGEFYQKRKDQERLYLKEIDTLFHSLKPVYLYQRETDVMDLEGLTAIGEELGAILTMMGRRYTDFSSPPKGGED